MLGQKLAHKKKTFEGYTKSASHLFVHSQFHFSALGNAGCRLDDGMTKVRYKEGRGVT